MLIWLGFVYIQFVMDLVNLWLKCLALNGEEGNLSLEIHREQLSTLWLFRSYRNTLQSHSVIHWRTDNSKSYSNQRLLKLFHNHNSPLT